MTTARAADQVKRGRVGRPTAQRVTLAEDWGVYGLSVLRASTEIRFPSPRYGHDPVAFFREILGVEPWTKQVEILEAVRDHDRVAVKSGRRVSKSHTAAGVALWWYSGWEDARCVMTSTTARQVDAILWRELSMMRARAGRCVRCKAELAAMIASGVPSVVAEQRIGRPCPHSALIDGDLGQLARTGLKSLDFREIWGFTASQAEAVQGIAGSRMLFIVDEASGVPQPIYDAIEGNRAGGAKVLLQGNPTKNEGEFFDAFHGKAAANRSGAEVGVGYHTVTISSEDSPNVREGRVVIPGLATADYIREREIEWGRDSAMFRIHVLGEFAIAEEGRIFSVHAIAEAEQRWEDTEAKGRLYLGLDPAGESGSGDDSCFVARRGLKMLELEVHRGFTDDAHLAHALLMLDRLKLPREVPVLVIDREGSVGSSLYGKCRAYVEANPGAFELVAVRASDRAIRNPLVYDRMRDGLAANLEAWFRDGGAILEDVKLAKELHALEWRMSDSGRLKLTPKKLLRKELGRSPDRYDGLALSCWEPLSLRLEEDESESAAAAVPDTKPTRRAMMYDDEDDGGPSLDPYEGSRAWRR